MRHKTVIFQIQSKNICPLNELSPRGMRNKHFSDVQLN